MEQTAIFFGSDTGNTARVARQLQKLLGGVPLYDVAQASFSQLLRYPNLILGMPTWYHGELQCDWDEWLPEIQSLRFEGKKIALFGLGDQEDYAETFCDALGIVAPLLQNRGAKIIGLWPSRGYTFLHSKALKSAEYFWGLVIDEDRQPEQTSLRLAHWVQQLRREFLQPL